MEITTADALTGRGWTCLGEEDGSGYNTAGGKALCSNIPVGTVWARMTVRTATVVITSDGTTAPSATAGIDYAAGTHDLPFGKNALTKMKGFSAGAATIHISYYGAGI